MPGFLILRAKAGGSGRKFLPLTAAAILAAAGLVFGLFCYHAYQTGPDELKRFHSRAAARLEKLQSVFETILGFEDPQQRIERFLKP